MAGSSQGVPYAMDVRNDSASATLEDILASAAGPQTATATLDAASTSYTVVAVFNPDSDLGPTLTSTGRRVVPRLAGHW